MSMLINYVLLYLFIMWVLMETITFVDEDELMLSVVIDDVEGGFSIIFWYILCIVLFPIYLYKWIKGDW